MPSDPKRGMGEPCAGRAGNTGAAGTGVTDGWYDTTGCGGGGVGASGGICTAGDWKGDAISSGALLSNLAVFSGGTSQPDLVDEAAGVDAASGAEAGATISAFAVAVDRSLSFRARADFCCWRFRRPPFADIGSGAGAGLT